MKKAFLIAVIAGCSCLLAQELVNSSPETAVAVTGHPAGCTCPQCQCEKNNDKSCPDDKKIKNVSSCAKSEPYEDDDDMDDDEDEFKMKKSSMESFVQYSQPKIALA